MVQSISSTFPKKRSRKGEVSLISKRERLLVTFPRSCFGGKQRWLSLGLTDTPKNRVIAENKIAAIQADIDLGQFDLSLEKYKPQVKKQVYLDKLATIYPNLVELYQSYIELRKNQVSPGCWKFNYLHHLSKFKECPYESIQEAEKIKEWALKNFSIDATKRLLIQANACVKWGIRTGKVKLKVSPFEGLTLDLKKLKKVEIEAFSVQERDLILKAFKQSRYYSYYYPFVYFLFFSGCRISEATALTWEDISSDFRFIIFNKVNVAGKGGYFLKKGLKTEQVRRFPCNAYMQRFLKKLNAENSASKLVFPSPKGKLIDQSNFSQRGWKKTIETLNIPYLKLYSTRHTFITLALEQGMHVKDLARIVGNSPEIIYKFYASSNVSLISVPSL